MGTVSARLCVILLLGAFLCVRPAFADWTSQLEAGGQVRVDPTTNRVTVTRHGVSTPLWDGVHRLKDGSVITVHNGQVVPNEDILRARKPAPPVTDQAQAWVGTPIIGLSPCEKLVRRVCGEQQQCGQAPACGPAQQLLDMERDERAKSDYPGSMTYSSGQCQEAAKDTEFFRQCTP